MANSPRRQKKSATEHYTLLGILINRYEYRVEVGLNTSLQMRPGMALTSDPLYAYGTVLDIEGNCVYPDDRAGVDGARAPCLAGTEPDRARA